MTLLSVWQRRRSARVEGLWVGRYRAAGARHWQGCHVLDVGVGGCGLAMPPDMPFLAGDVEVDLRLLSAPRRRLVLRGSVRNGYVLPDGWHRIGLEFTNLRGRRQRTLAAMVRRGRRRHSTTTALRSR